MAEVYFADTSALCKRYVTELGTAWLKATIDPSTGCHVIIARTTMIELIAAISRRALAGSITSADGDKAKSDFRADLATEFQVIELSPTLGNRAMALAEKHGLRGYDAIQLAAVLEVYSLRASSGHPALVLLSSDLELNSAAQQEGLIVEDPNAHP